MGLFGFRTDILYWPGCYSEAYLKDSISQHQKILKKIGISTKKMNFACCGGILIEAGYEKEARRLARENLNELKNSKIKKIITSCPLCYKTFSQDYPKMLPDWDIEIEFIIQTIYRQIKNNYQNQIENKEKILYYDSCILAKDSNLQNESRELLKILGYEIIKFPWSDSKNNCLCCGSCSNLPNINKEIANNLAEYFIKQIKITGIKKIITPDPQAYLHLKENLKDTDIEIIEFSEVLKEKIK